MKDTLILFKQEIIICSTLNYCKYIKQNLSNLQKKNRLLTLNFIFTLIEVLSNRLNLLKDKAIAKESAPQIVNISSV